jgi:two-component system response regulator DegU
VVGRIRVLVADDHEPFRRSLVHLLSLDDDIEVVGQAGNGGEAWQLCTEMHPDVVLMDLAMPVMDGAEATERIKRDAPDVRVIILTVFSQESFVRNALKAGADHYLTKGLPREELLSALKTVVGETTGMEAHLVRQVGTT